MADVQAEHGYTRVADALLEALMRAPMPARHLRVVLAVIRLTYGYGKRSDRIAAAQLVAATGIDDRDLRRIVADLAAWGVIERTRGVVGIAPALGIQKDWERWSIGATARGIARGVSATGAGPRGRAPGAVAPGGAVHPGSGGAVAPGAGPPLPETTLLPKTEEPIQATARAQAVWSRLSSVAAQYGVTWATRPGTAQLRTLAARLRDDRLSEDDLAAVMRGYIALRGTEARGDFNPLAFLTVKTLFAPKNWPDYLAAGRNPPPRNAAPGGPDHVQRHPNSPLAALDRILARDERAARARDNPGPLLRAVPGDS